LEGDGAIGVHESIVTDFHEPGGEHVLHLACLEWKISCGMAVASLTT
jgi:hypothetical protein